MINKLWGQTRGRARAAQTKHRKYKSSDTSVTPSQLCCPRLMSYDSTRRLAIRNSPCPRARCLQVKLGSRKTALLSVLPKPIQGAAIIPTSVLAALQSMATFVPVPVPISRDYLDPATSAGRLWLSHTSRSDFHLLCFFNKTSNNTSHTYYC